ncbi:MAG TPA: glycosyltransferase family 2 protein [Chryseolinea sp.]|nr:glycosyltransferase family 2 protein [Chryseolinea sp.]
MTQTDNRVAGTVVLYNPPHSTYECISSYFDQVEKIYVVDNSVIPNEQLIDKLVQHDKIVYINNHGNLGIATALNIGARNAIINGFQFLLTMDQDTSLESTYVAKLMQSMMEAGPASVGIMSPRYTVDSELKKPLLEEVLVTMTSGNILNLTAFQHVGPFLEELFIDHVDHEYCLRLWSNGYKVIQANDIQIIHRPGNIVKLNAFGKEIIFSSHSPLRQYYFWRNGLYVARLYKKQYPAFNKMVRSLLMKEFLKVPFEDLKRLRIKMMMQGLLDYRRNKFGPLREN